ncbi:IS66 family transposase OrfC [Oleiphilus messinensis]|uniref:IS66 family transposase OrfC n=1 Tax=Oleiphilus messinensis TaxID=141451 RepID=A0A1Y0I9Q3_9GAMM|nr:IS66 family transposase [Oleiphilus messinensis]ARU57238.1 IS66 family transposase OrfC [Oleiphilus messinensis]
MDDTVIEPLPPQEAHSKVLQENARLQARVVDLERQLNWYQKQVFGSKTEKRVLDPPEQTHFHALLGEVPEPPPEPEEKQTITYHRGVASKQRQEDDVNGRGLRFTNDVPVQVIELLPDELRGEDADQYEIIGTKVTYRLAQQTSNFVVLQFERPVIKRKSEDKPITPPAPDNVLERSVADVSFIVGLLIDKFLYHLPLHRQHQRLTRSGVTLSRTTLTNLSKRAIELLRPIAVAQLEHVLQSKVLAMDETPIKAGRQGPGKLKQCWFWPIFGEENEVVFTFANTRGRMHIEKTLKKHFTGTLLTDGYSAYASYQKQVDGLIHAQCWVHGRRMLLEAETQEPEAVQQALRIIQNLYAHEELIREQRLAGEKKRHYRLTHSKPLVDAFFIWCEQQIGRPDLTPSDDWLKSLNYMLKRQDQLRVFLEDPDVAMDTNHLEREIRPIPLGKKNWLFCWTELGAEHVGIIQSLISTCKLHDINPTTYLIDVLQRIDYHPAKEIIDLTPRVWKEKFASNPLRSILDNSRNGR